MSNALAKFGGNLPVDPATLETGLRNVQQSVQGSLGGMPLLRLLKDGSWVYSSEDIEVELGSEWALNPYSIHHGWACWGDSVLHGEVMVPYTDAPPARGTLPDFGYEWKPQLAMHLQCVSGEDTGLTVIYKGTSLGMKNAFKVLMDATIAQLRADPTHCIPVLKLEVDSYQHKQHGRTYIPILELVRFVALDDPKISSGDPSAYNGNDDDEGSDALTATEPEPVATPTPRRRASKAQAAEATQPESGRRRRRRG